MRSCGVEGVLDHGESGRLVAAMDMRGFRHVTGIKVHWIFALGLGAFWLILFVLPKTQLNDDVTNDEVAVRFVERELMLLEAGENSGWFVSFWIGRSREEKVVRQLAQVLENSRESRRVIRLQDHLADLAARGGESVEDLFSEEEQTAQLWRSFLVRYWFPLAALGGIPALWMMRRKQEQEGRIWRVTTIWSAGTVLTIGFLSMLMVEWGWEKVWPVLSNFSSQHLGDLLTSIYWRAGGALLAALVLIGSWSGIYRVFIGKQKVNWVAVLQMFCILMLCEALLSFLWGRDVIGNPESLFWNLKPTLWDYFYDFMNGVVLAPVFEELLFRGVLFLGLMKRLGVPVAALLSSALFAVMHTQYDLWGMLSVGLFGMACCWLTWKTRSIKSGVVLHALYNGLITMEIIVFYQMPLP